MTDKTVTDQQDGEPSPDAAVPPGEPAAEAAAPEDDKPKVIVDVADDESGKNITVEEEGEDSRVAELKDQLLRAIAETENIRRRSQREVEDAAKYAMANFARDMLSVGDNLCRAIDSLPQDEAGDNAALTALVDGVTLTQRELLAALERHGIKLIEPMGEQFDHNFHQAMFEVEDAENEPGIIVQVLQAGYVIAGRLLRPAMVGVAKKPAGEKDETPHIDTKV
jgi:molecular chaperone GrpE